MVLWIIRHINLLRIKEINFDQKLEKNISAVFFSNKIEKKIHGYLKLKGISYQLNLDPMNDEILKNLVLLRIELKQHQNEGIPDLYQEDGKLEKNKDNKQEPIIFQVHNKMSIESYHDFLNLFREKGDTSFIIQNYKDLLENFQMLNKLSKVSLLETVLSQVKRNPWKFHEDCGMYYYAQFHNNSESSFCSGDIGILTMVENFLDFHVEINKKKMF